MREKREYPEAGQIWRVKAEGSLRATKDGPGIWFMGFDQDPEDNIKVFSGSLFFVVEVTRNATISKTTGKWVPTFNGKFLFGERLLTRGHGVTSPVELDQWLRAFVRVL